MSMKVDMISNSIIVSKGFYEELSDYTSEAYAMVQAVKKDYPSMNIVVKSSRRGKRTNTNKGLTYDYMRRFIRIMDRENLITFEDVIEHYEEFGQTGGELYNNVKEWFLKTYPRHKEMIADTVPQRVADVVHQKVA